MPHLTVQNGVFVQAKRELLQRQLKAQINNAGYQMAQNGTTNKN